MRSPPSFLEVIKLIKNKNLVFGKVVAASPAADKSFQLPKLATGDLPTAAAAYKGCIVFDSTTGKVKVCTNASGSYAWEGISSSP